MTTPTLSFAPATKKQAKARIALEGPSGSGKTYTSLITARVLGQRIALIDTEHRSASLYADEFTFDTLELDRYDPQLLVQALAVAGGAGYDVVIIDSLSHFWMGTDGMLEQVDRAAKRSQSGNTFGGWKEMRPVERKMIEAMLAYPGHLIATLRTKTDWVVEENERGKKAPRKIGLKAEQREGLEYEFTLVGTLDIDNTLVVTKSRCKTLSGAVIAQPDDKFGRTLLEWLDAGAVAGPTAAELRDEALDPHATIDELRALHAKVTRLGLLGAPVLDEHGDSTVLGEFIVSKGREAAGRTQDGGQQA
jgi:AAA domain-containing protein